MDFKERSFTEKEIELDGNHYYDCAFTRCTLIYKGLGNYTLQGCTYIESRFYLRGQAGIGLRFLKHAHELLDEDSKLELEVSFLREVFGVVIESEEEIKPSPTTAFDLENSSLDIEYVSIRNFDKVVKAKEGSKISIKNSLVSSHKDLDDTDLEALKIFVGKAIKSEVPRDIEPAIAKAIQEELTKLQNELSQEKPQNAILQESLKTIRNIAEGIAGGMITPILVQQLPALLKLIGLS